VSNSNVIASPSSARSEVETLLLEHPDVVEALMTNEEGPDGHSYPVAYVVPHADRMKEAKARIYLADRDKRVAQWKRTFDQVYSRPVDYSPSFVGWTNSYTNKPLPETEMREWLDCTVERIMSLRPQKILEVGCGVGLLVKELAPRCSVYHGTDLSPVAVGRLREFVASKPELEHVRLFECEATKMDAQTPGSVDTVVINSVVQYFPDIDYLSNVLNEAARVVSSGGRIFVGDVRHLGLLPLFHGAVQLAKAPPKASARWMKRRVTLSVEQDRELAIDPQYFLNLSSSMPRITGVEILLKKGKYHNELTRYRYDVVLHVGAATSAPEAELESNGLTAAELVSRFKAQRLASVIIRDIPNRRLESDIASVRRLWSADDGELIEDIRRSIGPEVHSGIDPDDFWGLSDTLQVDIQVGWRPDSASGQFDVTLAARALSSSEPAHRRQESILRVPHQGVLATDPLEVAFKQQLGLELFQRLSERLPEARLPAAVLAVNELPPGQITTSDAPPSGPAASHSVHNLALKFQQVAAMSPAAAAVICKSVHYDFQTLNGLANRFARWLAGRGVGRGQVVCLELPKMIEAYALALACIKLGAPYTFLDPAAPTERSRLMIERCKPAIIISINDGAGNRVVLGEGNRGDDLRREIDALADANLPESEWITGTDPAYVMFTSGSTGEPKGVVIPHQGVLHLVDWAASHLGISSKDRLTNVNPIYFDNSVFDIYAGLLNGAAVVALDAKSQPPAALVAEITKNNCTFFFAVPTLFMFLDSMQLLTPEKLAGVTRFMFGGEGFPIVRLRRFFNAFTGKAQLINCYGPTETSCICSGLVITDSALENTEGFAPLGQLNPNFSHRILDDELKPVAPGDVGELWLGGPCVGLGYVNNPEETARRFQQDPLVDGYRSILYRTGDLVLLDQQSGLLRFRGRADNQVKLRGYRVELEEIDHAVGLIPGVVRALAIVNRDASGSGRLVVAYSGAKLSDADLFAHCNKHLPSHMMPSHFTWLNDIPTNSNGKADRRAVAALLQQSHALARAS
jgi:D-alanine--poly(phosphoribitol) ligase subunit 1